MLKNPIPKVSNQLQYRAIGIINGKFTPHDNEQLNRGFLIDKNLQIVGIWDPYQLNDFTNDSSKTNFSKLLEELDLKDNYFSVRGELVFVNTQKKEIVIKICAASKLRNLKNKNFKLVIKGEIPLKLLNSFVSLDINRDGNSLRLIKYEVIEKDLSVNN